MILKRLNKLLPAALLLSLILIGSVMALRRGSLGEMMQPAVTLGAQPLAQIMPDATPVPTPTRHYPSSPALPPGYYVTYRDKAAGLCYAPDTAFDRCLRGQPQRTKAGALTITEQLRELEDEFSYELVRWYLSKWPVCDYDAFTAGPERYALYRHQGALCESRDDVYNHCAFGKPVQHLGAVPSGRPPCE